MWWCRSAAGPLRSAGRTPRWAARRRPDDRVRRRHLAVVDLGLGDRQLAGRWQVALDELRQAAAAWCRSGPRRRRTRGCRRGACWSRSATRRRQAAEVELTDRERHVLARPADRVAIDVQRGLEPVVALHLLLDVERRREPVRVEQRGSGRCARPGRRVRAVQRLHRLRIVGGRYAARQAERLRVAAMLCAIDGCSTDRGVRLLPELLDDAPASAKPTITALPTISPSADHISFGVRMKTFANSIAAAMSAITISTIRPGSTAWMSVYDETGDDTAVRGDEREAVEPVGEGLQDQIQAEQHATAGCGSACHARAGPRSRRPPYAYAATSSTTIAVATIRNSSVRTRRCKG